MAREEARARVIEDSTTGINLIINSDGTLTARIKDSDGDSVTLSQKTMDYSIPVVLASDQSAIPVSTTPITPANRTPIKQSGTSTVTKLGGTATTSYTIPNGETVNISSFSFGGYLPANTDKQLNCKCVLYYRPNGSGNTTGQVLLDTIYHNGSSFYRETFAEGEIEYTGDGTAVFEMDITNWSQDDAELYRQIRGYY